MSVFLFAESLLHLNPAVTAMACSGPGKAETLEGFHEVNLASPTTPDLQNQAEQRPPQPSQCPPPPFCTAHTPWERPLLAAPPPCGPTSSPRSPAPGQEAESLDGHFLSAEDGEECSALSESLSRLRSPSVMEVREKGYEKLKEELVKAQRDLLLKDEECERLSKVRDLLGQELEELTASLFQEAHKMVREANVKQANAEKQLKEALGKIDVLQAEVQALKTLVLSSPTSPLGELPSVGGDPRPPSGRATAGTRAPPPPSWGRSPTPRPRSQSYASAERKCALSGQTKTCKHRIKFGDSSNYYYVSPYCRYRITAVCNFFTYIRYIHQGLVKQQDAEQIFWEVMQLRREMSLAKLGYYKDQL
ncbi:hypothetical protein F7725_022065 [Dissostichus mawsoni]|uniref:GDP/GTP exchange factor Sec2 N-terminal domain-containing protein n=1 Tax=Dissostichus mawsoni TaxID=36200 RepID=A0A7J5ZDG2_DISMA|nr:hypothetical protein F7725_022065 [Dissostichus mawsoni]